MNVIIKYILNMIPYIVIVIPIYLLARLIYLKVKKKDINWRREVTMFIFFSFIIGLASQTVIPKFKIDENGFRILNNGVHKTNLIPFKVISETYYEVIVNGNINYFLINFLGNIIIFMPIGILVLLLWDLSNIKVIFIGFCTSLFIEISQLFLIRGTDVDDLILNTIGTILGLAVYRIYRKISLK